MSNGICSQSLISRFEAGKEVPNILVLKELCEKLEIKLDTLFLKDCNLAVEIEELLFIHYLQKDYLAIENILEKQYHSVNLMEREFYKGIVLFHNDKNYKSSLERLKYLLEKIAIHKLGGLDYNEIEPFVYSYIGVNYLFMGKLNNAENYLYKSLESLNCQPLYKWEKVKGEIFFHVGLLEIERKNFYKAKQHFINTKDFCLTNGYLYYFEETQKMLAYLK